MFSGDAVVQTWQRDHEVSVTNAAIDERDLVVALQARQEWAYEAIVRLHGGRLLAVARRFTKNDADAQDVLQSAYLNAFRAIERFEGNCQLATWLHRIVVNTALMKLRSIQRKPEESIETLLPNFHDDGRHADAVAEWTMPADMLLQRGETRAIVRACIDRLPPTYRVVLIMRDIEEQSTQEVADALGTTPTAIKVRLHRARQALSTLLRQHFAES